jgi:hypothetical protein
MTVRALLVGNCAGLLTRGLAKMFFVTALAVLSNACHADIAFAQQPAEPEHVVVGAYVNDVQAVKLGSDSHIVDFYLWFRWKNASRDALATIEFMNAANATARSSAKLYDQPKPQPDGSVYNIIHFNGEFSSKFPLRNYPFDSHVLTIELEDTQRDVSQLVFDPDSEPIKINQAIQIPGFELSPPSLNIVSNFYPTSFGDLADPTASSYSRIVISIPIQRPLVSGLINLLLPAFLIILSAGLGLLIRPDRIDGRIGLCITALLTMIARQLSTNGSLPDVDYLMLVDKIYIISYFFILAVLAVMVRSSWTIKRNGIEIEARRDRRFGALVMGAYLAALAWIIGPAIWSRLF